MTGSSPVVNQPASLLIFLVTDPDSASHFSYSKLTPKFLLDYFINLKQQSGFHTAFVAVIV